MTNPALTQTYAQYKISSMKLHFWGSLWKLLFVNPLPFSLNIVINDPILVTFNDILEKLVIYLDLKEDLLRGIRYLVYSSLKEYE